MELTNQSQPKVYFVYDPMCSWCWGYAPTWNKLQTELVKLNIKVVYQLGGLAADSTETMPEEMQSLLKQTWHKINTQLNTPFNYDFWTQCRPQRSTYPACRAALIARDKGLEQQMLAGIQAAYYLKAKNPSDLNTLINIAKSIGLNATDFINQMNCKHLNQRLMNEISAARQLPIQGFPSLVLHHKGELIPIVLDYRDWQASFNAITSIT